MKIWRRQCHVSQARNLENETVLFFAGHIEPSVIGLGERSAPGEIVGHRPEFLEHISADIDTLVATGASVSFELVVALLFFGSQGVFIPAQIFVEAAIGGS